MSSCASISPYNRNLLDDEEMEFGETKRGTHSSEFLGYREGSSGAGGSKKGGGCGCN